MNEAEKRNQNAHKVAIDYLTKELGKMNNKIKNQDFQIHQLRERLNEFDKLRAVDYANLKIGPTA